MKVSLSTTAALALLSLTQTSTAQPATHSRCIHQYYGDYGSFHVSECQLFDEGFSAEQVMQNSDVSFSNSCPSNYTIGSYDPTVFDCMNATTESECCQYGFDESWGADNFNRTTGCSWAVDSTYDQSDPIFTWGYRVGHVGSAELATDSYCPPWGTREESGIVCFGPRYDTSFGGHYLPDSVIVNNDKCDSSTMPMIACAPTDYEWRCSPPQNDTGTTTSSEISAASCSLDISKYDMVDKDYYGRQVKCCKVGVDCGNGWVQGIVPNLFCPCPAVSDYAPSYGDDDHGDDDHGDDDASHDDDGSGSGVFGDDFDIAEYMGDLAADSYFSNAACNDLIIDVGIFADANGCPLDKIFNDAFNLGHAEQFFEGLFNMGGHEDDEDVYGHFECTGPGGFEPAGTGNGDGNGGGNNGNGNGNGGSTGDPNGGPNGGPNGNGAGSPFFPPESRPRRGELMAVCSECPAEFWNMMRSISEEKCVSEVAIAILNEVAGPGGVAAVFGSDDGSSGGDGGDGSSGGEESAFEVVVTLMVMQAVFLPNFSVVPWMCEKDCDQSFCTLKPLDGRWQPTELGHALGDDDDSGSSDSGGGGSGGGARKLQSDQGNSNADANANDFSAMLANAVNQVNLKGSAHHLMHPDIESLKALAKSKKMSAKASASSASSSALVSSKLFAKTIKRINLANKADDRRLQQEKAAINPHFASAALQSRTRKVIKGHIEKAMLLVNFDDAAITSKPMPLFSVLLAAGREMPSVGSLLTKHASKRSKPHSPLRRLSHDVEDDDDNSDGPPECLDSCAYINTFVDGEPPNNGTGVCAFFADEYENCKNGCSVENEREFDYIEACYCDGLDSCLTTHSDIIRSGCFDSCGDPTLDCGTHAAFDLEAWCPGVSTCLAGSTQNIDLAVVAAFVPLLVCMDYDYEDDVQPGSYSYSDHHEYDDDADDDQSGPPRCVETCFLGMPFEPDDMCAFFTDMLEDDSCKQDCPAHDESTLLFITKCSCITGGDIEQCGEILNGIITADNNCVLGCIAPFFDDSYDPTCPFPQFDTLQQYCPTYNLAACNSGNDTTQTDSDFELVKHMIDSRFTCECDATCSNDDADDDHGDDDSGDDDSGDDDSYDQGISDPTSRGYSCSCDLSLPCNSGDDNDEPFVGPGYEICPMLDMLNCCWASSYTPSALAFQSNYYHFMVSLHRAMGNEIDATDAEVAEYIDQMAGETVQESKDWVVDMCGVPIDNVVRPPTQPTLPSIGGFALSQWVSSAKDGSGCFNVTHTCFDQVVGFPSTYPSVFGGSGSWQPANASMIAGATVSLTVEFESPVFAATLTAYETWSPGFITSIEALDHVTDVFISVYSGAGAVTCSQTEITAKCADLQSYDLQPSTFKADTFRLTWTVDSPERRISLDAVSLTGKIEDFPTCIFECDFLKGLNNRHSITKAEICEFLDDGLDECDDSCSGADLAIITAFATVYTCEVQLPPVHIIKLQSAMKFSGMNATEMVGEALTEFGKIFAVTVAEILDILPSQVQVDEVVDSPLPSTGGDTGGDTAGGGTTGGANRRRLAEGAVEVKFTIIYILDAEVISEYSEEESDAQVVAFGEASFAEINDKLEVAVESGEAIEVFAEAAQQAAVNNPAIAEMIAEMVVDVQVEAYIAPVAFETETVEAADVPVLVENDDELDGDSSGGKTSPAFIFGVSVVVAVVLGLV